MANGHVRGKRTPNHLAGRTASGGYKSYNYGRGCDPVLHQLDELFQLVSCDPNRPVSNAFIERVSGVSSSTLRAYRKKDRRRPQNPTLEAIINGLGAHRAIHFGNHVIKPPRDATKPFTRERWKG